MSNYAHYDVDAVRRSFMETAEKARDQGMASPNPETRKGIELQHRLTTAILEFELEIIRMENEGVSKKDRGFAGVAVLAGSVSRMQEIYGGNIVEVFCHILNQNLSGETPFQASITLAPVQGGHA